MAEKFNRNSMKISKFYEDVKKGNYIIDSSYQRRKIWSKQDKIRLIETILLDLIIPEIFFWQSQVDPDTGKTITHIVDGQQRVDAITGFISEDYKLISNCLLDDSIKQQFGNKSFTQLPEDAKVKIWNYRISIVEIDKDCSKDEIKQMFYRLNLTEYSLNKQEKRNSFDSVFGDKAEELAENDFWKTCKVFSNSDYKRMKDIEYCCNIYILSKQGIIDQTNDKIINDYYSDYKYEFDKDETLTNRIYSAMNNISKLRDNSVLQFVSKKTQMYTLFSFSFFLQDENIEINTELFEKFKLFVLTYNEFKNEYVINFEDAKLRETYEKIKSYKLASSEGINKYHNRSIRLEVLKQIILEDEYIKDKLTKIYEILLKKSEERLNVFEDVENEDFN